MALADANTLLTLEGDSSLGAGLPDLAEAAEAARRRAAAFKWLLLDASMAEVISVSFAEMEALEAERREAEGADKVTDDVVSDPPKVSPYMEESAEDP